jgi:hypothetical protein
MTKLDDFKLRITGPEVYLAPSTQRRLF